jgi:DNA-directed RNA polymerase specialized sigma24 family protein
MHPRDVRAEREVVAFPTERVDAWARFDAFVEEEHERLYKALYFVTGSREDAEDLSQDAFMKLWERWEYDHRRNQQRNRKIGAFAVAAVIGAAAIAVFLGTRGGQDTVTPADPSTVNSVEATAERVATSFLEAYGAADADRAIAELADDIVPAVGVETRREFRRLLSLMEAQGWQQVGESCDAGLTLPSGTRVLCTFDFHAIRSDEIGLGPYSGSSADITVLDGEVVRASINLEIEEFGAEMWDPFAAWVAENYPEDGAVMYNDSYTDYRLTEASIRLWELRTREYVEDIGGQ